MRTKHKPGLLAAGLLLAAIPGTLVVQDRLEAAERNALEHAAQEIFQRDADRSTAQWRQYAAPDGRIWDRAVARAKISQIEKVGERAKVWVDQITTPRTVTPSGGRPQPDTPFVSSHVFVFAPEGDGWRLVQDLSSSED